MDAPLEVIGVDIGGTNIKVGRLVGNTLVQKELAAVDASAPANETLETLFRLLERVMTDAVTAIGIGVPSIVDAETGVAYDVQNIPSWKRIHFKEIIMERYHLPVYVNNDANCFILGEKQFGKAKDYGNCVGLSIGTGLGMGIIINHQLYNGVLCGAGEVGMLTYKEGILEEYTGSFFFSRWYGKSAKELFAHAERGDSAGLAAFGEFGCHLGEAVKNVLYAYAPEAIIFGGSISKAYHYFKETMEQTLTSFAYPEQLKKTMITTSRLEDSAILGAAALCLQLKPIRNTFHEN